VVGNKEFSVWLKSDRLEHGKFSGSYTLLGVEGHSRRDSDTGVVFRVNIADEGLEHQVAVFEDLVHHLSPGTWHADVPLPEVWPGGYVGIEVAYVGGGSGLSAAWLDPQIIVPFLSKKATSPNVLLVTADTTRRDDLAPYGSKTATPTLHHLASEGVKFDNAFTVATGTTPSHCSIFTASHSTTHGVYDNKTVLSPELTTLAEVLSDKGYETAAFVSAIPVSSALGLSRGFHSFDEFFGRDLSSGLGNYAFFERRADRTTSRFLDWMSAREKGPFFAWIHYFDPHQPYAPPQNDGSRAPSDPVDRIFENEEGEPRYVSLAQVVGEEFDAETITAYARSRYRDEIAHMDSEFGRIVRQLREQGLYDDTLIVFTADHGENFLEHGVVLALNHAGLFDAVVHVPLIIKFPGGRFGGLSTEELVASIDIAPTILAALGHDIPSSWQGMNILDHIGKEQPEPLRRALVIEGAHRHELSVRSRAWMYREVRAEFRQRQHILDYLGFGENVKELYDLAKYSGEDRDVYPVDEASVLFKRLETFEALGNRVGQPSIEDEEHLKALRALGYVQ
jgi:arylsulfatase A-like enzyme